ncbi:hypothetical protein BUALT_Bualt15G0125900 [Buddleja alternifolia]|uniref:VQ domain-containing protein n=1 Tax=Buddleja alternifolia TaxID=168488 RepID=A0AAV6WQE5_9LAMI|nr:hypothetical protein BUALT_Bualt15G0125900 [Buddleja alternifolia]
MDKGLSDECSSISSSSATITNSNRDMYLKQINKSSHKISKPTIRNTPVPIPIPPPMAAMGMTMNLDHPSNPPPQSQQPPVYNINKNDFRDVVQKLTGSPAHERLPPPVTQPRPPSSRLQRIRPPPLAQIRPQPQILPNDVSNSNPQPQPQILPGQAPLPPLPSVHPAAESPISAYMRFLQTSSPSPLWNGGGGVDVGQRMESPVSAYMRFLQSSVHSSSPRWNGVAPPLANPQQQPSSAFPLPFGCSIPSPRSSTYGMLSPSFLLSPTQLPPLSPTLPVPVLSPRWKGGM